MLRLALKRTTFRSHLRPTSLIKYGVVGFTSYQLFTYNSPIVNDVHAIDTTKHNLAIADDAETFEMGLYAASQQEELHQYNDYIKQRLRSPNIFKRIWYTIQFTVLDYIIDPLITFTRFIELSLILAPIVLSCPMLLYGKKSQTGAKLWYRLIRFSAELAGASFIKLGQWAATRTDFLPREMCQELNNLHSNAKAHSFETTKKIILKSFAPGNIPVTFDDIFEEFDETPIGVGAIAQVYLAKLKDEFIMRMSDLEHEMELQLKFKKDDKAYSSIIERFIITENGSLNNKRVAIKVLHPNVELKINRDLKLMKFFANMINAIPTMEWLSLPDEVDQFAILMRLQLDLRIEGLNLAKFRHNFKSNQDIHFPKPYLSFTTRDILVEEYMQAIPLEKILSIRKNFGKNLSKEISDKGLDSFLKMLIMDNFIHADLHPGNMMVRFYKNELFKHEKEYKIVKSSNEDDTNRVTRELLEIGVENEDLWCNKLSQLYYEGYHAEVCFLDVGIVTELNQTDRVNFIDLFKALSEFDGYKAGELMIERSRTPDTVVDTEVFALKVEKLVDRMKQRTFALGNLSIGDLLDQVLNMVRKHHVRMEGDFISIVVAILLLEGIGRQLDPELDLFARFVYALMIDYDIY